VAGRWWQVDGDEVGRSSYFLDHFDELAVLGEEHLGVFIWAFLERSPPLCRYLICGVDGDRSCRDFAVDRDHADLQTDLRCLNGYLFVIVGSSSPDDLDLDVQGLVDDALSFSELVNVVVLDDVLLWVEGRIPFLRAKEIEQGNLTVMLTFLRKIVVLTIWT
jgi:hypothetical protein